MHNVHPSFQLVHCSELQIFNFLFVMNDRCDCDNLSRSFCLPLLIVLSTAPLLDYYRPWSSAEGTPIATLPCCFEEIIIWGVYHIVRWKVHESTLLGIGSLSKLILDHVCTHKLPLDINTFLQNVVLVDLNQNGEFFLACKGCKSTTAATTVLWPFVWDNAGEPVPEG